MISLLRITTVVILILGIIAISNTTLAVKPQSIREVDRIELIAPLVEQQDNINNTTGCMWDADDSVQVVYAGYLNDSFTATECVITDWTNHLAAVVVVVKSRPAQFLTASIHFTNGGGVDVSSSELIPRDRHYSEIRFCTFTTEHDNQDPTWELVGDGVGWPTDVEFTITNINDSGKRIRAVSLRTVIATDSNTDVTRWCP